MQQSEGFRCMGTEVRFYGVPVEAARRERAFIEAFAARLSRFRDDSELCALNASPSEVVPASPLLRAAVRAGLWAAESTGGLVDPTVLRALERAGYRSSRGRKGADPPGGPARGTDPFLARALRNAPPRRPAGPAPDAAWRSVRVDDIRGVIARPPGTRLDTGGVGKGLAADAVAHRLGGHDRFVVDCGGDMVVGGPGAERHPYDIDVEHPLTGECAHRLSVAAGGVATSGLNVRVWRRDDDSYAHHLIDPATGEPAWTGLISVTALAPTALEAETLSKAALLRGPAGGRETLAAHGGLVVHDDGDVELVGPLRTFAMGVAA
jgi:thiamine biosynthesis lipoprotein